ncbi:MAG TPA: hypothetical protein VKZ53_17720 [Candidatus Angelobacter sp.]|nr:hypothetical protein [Candidatus Angelobacter sp.]
MMSLPPLRIVAASIFAAFCSLCVLAQSPDAQGALRDLTPVEKSEFFSAENRWRLKAIDLRSQADTVTPEVRASRNAYLRPLLQKAAEFWTPAAGAVGIGGGKGSTFGEQPELPTIPNGVWVIAKFESFHVFTADAESRLIYTEMNYRVNQVVRQPSPMSLKTGDVLDAQRAGGRMKRADGAIVSFLVEPERHSVQPGRTYLLAGRFDGTTHYFTIDKIWDVTSDKVVPITRDEINRAARGESKLAALSTDQAVQYLNSVLPLGSSH